MVTPRDIETKMFKVSFRGYNTTEVDEFLQEICDSYIDLYEENLELKKKAGLLSNAVGQYKSMEDTLQDALSVADKSADKIEKAAGSKAEEIIKNAELTAQSIIFGAEQKIADEEYRLEKIKRETEIYKAKIIDLLNAQLCVLKEYPQSGSIDLSAERPKQKMWNKKTETSVAAEEVTKKYTAGEISDTVTDVEKQVSQDTTDLSNEDTQKLEPIKD